MLVVRVRVGALGMRAGMCFVFGASAWNGCLRMDRECLADHRCSPFVRQCNHSLWFQSCRDIGDLLYFVVCITEEY